MAIVENNIVKKDWEKAEWLETKGGTFIFAGKTYSGANSDVSVLFNSDTGFIWVGDYNTDAEDVWSASDVRSWFKKEKPSDFPYAYEEMIPVIDVDGVKDDVLEHFGLTEFKDDIIARFNDIKPYGEEKEVKLM